ncbi:MAG: hypothetical protein AB7K52_03885 [Phycisphaerales bacterium]
MFFGRTVTRVVVITALAGGGLTLLAGPERVGALFHQTRDALNEKIDKAITDPVALRAQLRDLEATYPKRIAAVRSDLAEVRGQIDQLRRDQAVSARVVEMTSRDLDTLQGLLAQAEEARSGIQTVNFDPDAPERRIELVFDESRMSIEQAYAKTIEINNTRQAYASRSADVERDLGYLAKQEERLGGLLTKLETERGDFQAQLWQLDRQVDSIARNDRMIEILSRRQQSIEEQSRYKAASLDNLQAKVADIRAKQEAELAALATGEDRADYEQRAKLELDAKGAADARVEPTRYKKPRKAEVIEIRPVPAGQKPASTPSESDKTANNTPADNVG